MSNFKRNYGYSVMRSPSPAIGVELAVSRHSDTADPLDSPRTHIAYLQATDTTANNIFTGRAGLSALDAHVAMEDFYAQYPDATAETSFGTQALYGDVVRELAALPVPLHEIMSKAEAQALEEKRDAVALAVAGMDLATADAMVVLEAADAAEFAEQAVPIQQ